MPELPAGTVTFLFTDIEGSTRLLQQLGPRYTAVLGEHRDLLRAAFAHWRGHEVDTQGDAFFVAFTRAADALACAAEIQRSLAAHVWPEDAAVRVRIGLHTGEPIATDTGYVGLDVHRAARICSAGHGGQTLLSQATRDLVASALPQGADLCDLGEHRLKDLQRPEHLYQLVLPDLPADFPPLKTLDLHRHNLPVQPTPLLGRERELAEVCALLRDGDTRLVTLTGPGGIGKTRLGLQVAAEVGDLFGDGVFFVALATICDPSLVPGIVAQTLGLRESGGRSPAEGLAAYLADRHALLLLDNFEQVAEAAPVVAGLLASCPRVRLLVTSRELLHLRGEQEYPVPPLALPASLGSSGRTAPPDVVAISRSPAVALFIQRARAVKPDFTATSANITAIAELCTRLDGLPLAIELAAAHVKLLSPQALVKRLHGRLDLLSGGARDLPDRQRTLRDTIAWSYDLLSPDVQTLFRRLAVFAGGWTLEAAEAVCAAAGEQPEQPGQQAAACGADVLGGLGALVDKSLVRQQEGGDSEPRFTLLQTIRDYAQEQLDASGEAGALRAAHAAYYVGLAEQAEPHLTRRDQGEWLHRLAREHANLRAALAWADESGDDTLGLRLVGALWRFWYTHGDLGEGREWLERLLARSTREQLGAPGDMSALRAKALVGAATLASTQDDLQRATALGEESLVLSRMLGDDASVANALNALGFIALHRGDVVQATARFEESLALSRRLGDSWALAKVLSSLGQCAYLLADYSRAAALFEECLTLLRQAGSRSHIATNLLYLGHVAREQGHIARAATCYREGLALSRDLGDKLRIARGLEALATVATEEGQPERGARLLGAASALRGILGASLHPLERPAVDQAIAILREQLGDAVYFAAWEAGRALPLHDAIAEALSASCSSD